MNFTTKIQLDKGFNSIVYHISHIQGQECINCTELRASKNLTVRGGGNHLGSIGSLGVLQSRYPVQLDAKLPPSYQFSYQNYSRLGIYLCRAAANIFEHIVILLIFFIFAKNVSKKIFWIRLIWTFLFPAIRCSF